MTPHPVDLEALQKLLDEERIAAGSGCPHGSESDICDACAYGREIRNAKIRAFTPALLAEVRAGREALGRIARGHGDYRYRLSDIAAARVAAAALASPSVPPPQEKVQEAAQILRWLVENQEQAFDDNYDARRNDWPIGDNRAALLREWDRKIEEAKAVARGEDQMRTLFDSLHKADEDIEAALLAAGETHLPSDGGTTSLSFAQRIRRLAADRDEVRKQLAAALPGDAP